MMNIIYISSEYPQITVHGGIGTYTKYIAEGMRERGHDVHVICKNPESVSTRFLLNGVHIHHIPSSDFPLPESKLFFPLRKLMRFLFYNTLVRVSWSLAAGREIRNICQNEFDISVIEYPECGAEGLFVPRTNALEVVRLHTPWSMVKKLDNIKECWGDEFLFPYLEKLSIKKADRITSPSKAMFKKITHGLNNSITNVIPNPISSENFRKTTGKNWIYTGRVEKRKGVHHLITAFENVCKSHNAPQLIIAGAPYGTDNKGVSYGKYIETLIGSCECRNKITWLKGVPPEKINELLRKSSAAFFPSLWENFPYSCLEAMASGCAVIANNCGGFPEIITHNVNGLLVNTSSSDELELAMKTLLENPELVKQLGNAAAIFVSTHFDSKLICSQMESFYMSGIEAKGERK